MSDAPQTTLADTLRRALFSALRVSSFDEAGLLALPAERASLDWAVWALPIGLPFWAAEFVAHDTVTKHLDNPPYLIASAALFYTLGSLSLPGLAGVVAAVLGREAAFWRVAAALLWWNVGFMLLSAPATIITGLHLLSDNAQIGVELAVGVWALVVSAWILSRGLGLPGALAGVLVLLDTALSESLASWLWG